MKRSLQFLILLCLSCTLCWAGSDPFVGNWKLNPSKTRLTDDFKVVAAGKDKYTFIFQGTDSETIVTDGTDQPGVSGTTFSVTIEDPHTWKLVRKQGGHIVLTATWKLSEDGNMLHDAFTTPQPDGSTFTIGYVYRRTAGTSGFAGTWDSTSQDMISEAEMKIKLYENDGFSITLPPALGPTVNVKFDGKDYANPAVAPDFTSFGRRADDLNLEIIDKYKGKVLITQELKLSADRKTLTMTVHQAGKSKPDTLVFDRQ